MTTVHYYSERYELQRDVMAQVNDNLPYVIERKVVRQIFRVKPEAITSVVYYLQVIGQNAMYGSARYGKDDGRSYVKIGCKFFYGREAGLIRRWANAKRRKKA